MVNYVVLYQENSIPKYRNWVNFDESNQNDDNDVVNEFMRKRVPGHMRTVKAQISLRIGAV